MFIQEIHKNTQSRIHYTLLEDHEPTEIAGGVDVRVLDRDTEEELISGQAEANTENGDFIGYSFLLPLSITSESRPLLAEWEFEIDNEPIAQETEIDVVTPYVTPYAAKNFHESLNQKENSELVVAERIIRYLINRYCNQSFDHLTNIDVTIPGSGADTLLLPKRLLALKSVSAGDTVLFTPEQQFNYVMHDSPWSITRAPHDLNDTKRGFPGGIGTLFKQGVTYSITGDFGWRHVPAPITQASLLLMRDYFSPDKKYKEQYVHTVRAADWRMEFGKTGGETTGNADADSILDNFVNPRWAVLI